MEQSHCMLTNNISYQNDKSDGTEQQALFIKS